ncbi:MAG: hypothetical protein R2826_03100 [Thermoleophilia bacterium]
MPRRLLILLAIAALAVAAALVAFSSASFTTSSEVTVAATTDSVGDWLRVDSASSDDNSAHIAGYAHQANDPSLPFVASGGNASPVTIDWGSYPDTNTTYTFDRSFTFRTLAFPDSSVSQVTVTVSYYALDGELQPIRNVWINNVGSSGGSTTVTLGSGQKRQVNVQIRAKRKWAPGEQYHAHIVLTLTYSGGPAGYYVYDIPTLVTVE